MRQSDRGELTVEAERRITGVIRGLAEDQVDRGVDLNRMMRCDSCDIEKPPHGSSQYGAYALCNDCLLEFTLLLAMGEVDSVAEYMTKRPEDSPALLESRTGGDLEKSRRPLPKRTEKLMPSNEPC